MTIYKRFSLPVLLLLTGLSGCQDDSNIPEPVQPETSQAVSSVVDTEDSEQLNEQMSSNDQETSQAQDGQMTITGTLLWQEMEGGFYGFVTKDGKKFMLNGIAEEHRKNGIVLSVTGSVMTDMMTIQQFGQMFKVEDYSVIDESNASKNKGNAY